MNQGTKEALRFVRANRSTIARADLEARFGAEVVKPLFDLDLIQQHRHNGFVDLLPSGERVVRGWDVFGVAVIDGEEVQK